MHTALWCSVVWSMESETWLLVCWQFIVSTGRTLMKFITTLSPLPKPDHLNHGNFVMSYWIFPLLPLLETLINFQQNICIIFPTALRASLPLGQYQIMLMLLQKWIGCLTLFTIYVCQSCLSVCLQVVQQDVEQSNWQEQQVGVCSFVSESLTTSFTWVVEVFVWLIEILNVTVSVLLRCRGYMLGMLSLDALGSREA